MRNLEQFIPYGAGSPPAVVLGFTLYQQVLSVAGDGFAWLASIIAVVGVAAVMSGEIYAYKSAFRAFAIGERRAGFASFIAAALTTALVGYGVWSGQNSRALITTLAASVLIYLVFGFVQYVNTKAAERERAQKGTEQATSAHLEELGIQAKIAAEQAKIARAEARKAKLDKLSTVQQTVQSKMDRLDTPKIRAIKATWAEHPDWSSRQVAEAAKCSPMTALKYKEAK